MSVASKVAAQKVAHPELYCSRDRCLWRTGGGNCPRHPITFSDNPVYVAAALAEDSGVDVDYKHVAEAAEYLNEEIEV